MRTAIFRKLCPESALGVELDDGGGKLGGIVRDERGFAVNETGALRSFGIGNDGKAIGEGVKIFCFDAGAEADGRNQNAALHKFRREVRFETDANYVRIRRGPVFGQTCADDVESQIRHGFVDERGDFADVPFKAVEGGRIVEVA